MNLPLVSVVMPVYNSEKYLKEAIDSVLFQTYKNLELVIVDDGSSDSSKHIILSYRDDRIVLLQNDVNSGIVFSRNKGLDAARGEFVATLDSDDMALPDRIEKQVDFLIQHPDYGMCGTFYNAVDSNGKMFKKVDFCTSDRDIQTHLKIGNCFCNSTMLLRSKLAKELKYREHFDIVEDYELWYRISRRAKVANLPFYGTDYRVHGNNISVAKINDMFARVKKINVQILTDLNIDFSAQELELHSNLLNGTASYFATDERLDALESWIIRFYEKLRDEEKYNNRLLFKLIAEKWLVVAYKNKKYKKLFFNRVFPLNAPAYIYSFYKRTAFKLMHAE